MRPLPVIPPKNRDRFIRPVPSFGPDSKSPWRKISSASHDAPLLRRGLQCSADVLRADIDPNASGLAAPLDDAVERARHPQCRQRNINLDGEAFPIEVIEHVQRPEGTPVAELVRHEVHRPLLVGRRRNCLSVRLLANEPLPRLDAQ